MYLARWTEDVFSFGQIASDSQVSNDLTQKTKGQETETPSTEFISLQEAFDAYGMTEVHEPNWLLEGYALSRIDVVAVDDPFLRSFSASFTDAERRVGVDIMSYEGEPASQVQKIGGLVESVEIDGIMFCRTGNWRNWCPGSRAAGWTPLSANIPNI